MEIRKSLPIALAAAILANILVSWTPRYWSASVGICGVSLVAIAWAISVQRVALPRETVLVVLIGIWGPLQLLLHTSVLPLLTMRSSLVWIMSAVVFILASQILRGNRNRELFLRVILWAATILALAAMLQAYSRPVRVFGIIPVDANVVGTMYYKNHFAALMELAAPIALWEVRNGKIVTGGLCYATMFAAAITSLSRTGTIGVLAELVIFFAIMVLSRRWPLGPALAVVGTLVLLVTGASMVVGVDRIWERMEEAHPYQFRAQITRSTLDMVAERPWLGFGMGTWRPVYPRFARLDDGLIVNEAHNDLAQWAAEGGIPFLLLMTGLVAWLGFRIFSSMWGLGVLIVFAHCYLDYALRAPPLQFLWFALAGGLAVAQIDVRGSRHAEIADPVALTSELG